jgi:hypothetical protein
MRYLAIGLCVFMIACSAAAPTAPSFDAAPGSALSASAGATASAASPVPHFNLDAILRGEGFGLLKLRQEKDPTQDILFMDVWVRDLLPNTSYDLQRAVDVPQDGICTGTNWLTMGQGAAPQPVLTDDQGIGRAELWRVVPPTASASDIHFRVVPTGTSTAVLHSECFRLLRRD